MDTLRLAWAAGIFDAEGSISTHVPTRRTRHQPVLMVSQASRSVVPQLLLDFRSVLEMGSIVGPYRGYLYYWRSGDAGTIASVATLLWPWLGDVKRTQILSVVQRVDSLATVELTADIWSTHICRVLRDESQRASHELAWAGGFFTGEGSLGAYQVAKRSPTGTRPSSSISQASFDGRIPFVLERFREAVGDGSIHGPYGPRGWSKYPQYRWDLSGYAKVAEVMRRLWPWLDQKRQAQCDRTLGSDWRAMPTPR